MLMAGDEHLAHQVRREQEVRTHGPESQIDQIAILARGLGDETEWVGAEAAQ
jgi:hypothetical protein